MALHFIRPSLLLLAFAFQSSVFAHGSTFIVIPQYSELTRAARIEGTVMVDVAFDKDGNIQSTSINTASPRIPMLEPIVLGALAKWHIKSLSNAKLTFSFSFNLLPETMPDSNGEVASYVDLDSGQVKIFAKRARITAS